MSFDYFLFSFFIKRTRTHTPTKFYFISFVFLTSIDTYDKNDMFKTQKNPNTNIRQMCLNHEKELSALKLQIVDFTLIYN